MIALPLLAEPSAFSAGDLSQDEPYGLTNNEKLLLKNIKKVKHLNRDKNTLYSEVESLRSDLDGLRSVIEGQNASQLKHYKQFTESLLVIEELKVAQQSGENRDEAFAMQIAQLKEDMAKLVVAQEENFEALHKSISALDTTITTIETSYISKKEFKTLEDELNSFKTIVLEEFKKLNKKAKAVVKTKKPIEHYTDAQTALKKKKYEEALDGFSHAIASGYRPAASHYYSAEAYFGLKQYDKAIAFYKESYNRYKKGSYNKKLFLHTAISLEKIGKRESAQGFYQKVLDLYPDSKEAKVAKKALAK